MDRNCSRALPSLHIHNNTIWVPIIHPKYNINCPRNMFLDIPAYRSMNTCSYLLSSFNPWLHFLRPSSPAMALNLPHCKKYILRYSLCCFPTTLSMFPPPTACCTSPICTSSLHAPGTMLWSSSSASICPRSKLAYLILMRLCRQMHAVTTIFTTFVVWSIVLSKHRQRDVRMPNAFSTTLLPRERR